MGRHFVVLLCRTFAKVLLLASLLIFGGLEANAQCFGKQIKFRAPSTQAGDRAGWSVDFDDSWLVIGAREADTVGQDSGAVHVYRKTGNSWTYEVELTGSLSSPLSLFGSSVRVRGNWLFVGAPGGGDESQGRVYLFLYNGSQWNEVHIFQAADGAMGDGFGYSLDVDGFNLAIGAPGDDEGGTNTGSVYAFEYDGVTWSDGQRLGATSATEGASFGWSVSVNEAWLFAGAPFANGGQGAVSTFGYSPLGWLAGAEFQGLSDSEFGWSVDVQGDVAVAGHPGFDKDKGGGRPLAYDGANWVLGTPLEFQRFSGARYGEAVVVSGSQITLGGREEARLGLPTGAIARFRPQSNFWTLLDKLWAYDGSEGEGFGASLATFNGSLLVGAIEDDDSGAAYLLSEGRPGGVYGVGTPGTDGKIPTIEELGCPWLGNQDYGFRASNALDDAVGSLIVGFEGDFDDSFGWTRLVSLIGPPPAAFIFAIYENNGSIDVDIPLPRNSLLHGIDLYLQFIVVDPGAANGVAASQGLFTVLHLVD